jgi:hypothetical protein
MGIKIIDIKLKILLLNTCLILLGYLYRLLPTIYKKYPSEVDTWEMQCMCFISYTKVSLCTTRKQHQASSKEVQYLTGNQSLITYNYTIHLIITSPSTKFETVCYLKSFVK